jgi:hypothetical protein
MPTRRRQRLRMADISCGKVESGPCGRTGVAGSTVSIEKELVPGRLEPTGELRLRLSDAALEVVDLATTVALEVVVMAFAGELIPGRLAGNLDRVKPSVLYQRLDVPIDGGDTNCRMVRMRRLKGLLSR